MMFSFYHEDVMQSLTEKTLQISTALFPVLSTSNTITSYLDPDCHVTKVGVCIYLWNGHGDCRSLPFAFVVINKGD